MTLCYADIIRPEKPKSPWREVHAQVVSRAQLLDRGDRKNDLRSAAACESESTPIAGLEGSRMRRGSSKVRRSAFPRKPAARFRPSSSESQVSPNRENARLRYSPRPATRECACPLSEACSRLLVAMLW